MQTFRHGVLVVLTSIILGVVSGFALRMLIVPWLWLAFVIGVGVAFTGFMGRGLVVEWLLDRRYFRGGISGERRRGWNRARLASLVSLGCGEHRKPH
jgi:hypothetical protein